MPLRNYIGLFLILLVIGSVVALIGIGVTCEANQLHNLRDTPRSYFGVGSLFALTFASLVTYFFGGTIIRNW